MGVYQLWQYPLHLLLLLSSTASHSWPLRFLQDDAEDCNCQCSAPEPNGEVTTVQILLFDSPGIIAMVEENAEDYMRLKNGAVDIRIKTAKSLPELYAEIESDTRTGGGLFDAYFTNPIILGTAVVQNALLDLSPYIKASDDWTDILPVFRTHVTNFEDKIYLILLDGDTHAMFYRRDVLDHFGLNVPRTWDEYTEVAKAVHGKTFNNITLSGSCVSRIRGDHAQYWAHLVLSSITQTKGAKTGSLFDTADMSPLAGKAMAEMLRIHEESAMYGTDDEFEGTLNQVQNGHMNDGSCVLTYSWGDLFKRSKAESSVLHDKLGIAPTPGSTRVLDRETGELVPCDMRRCPLGKFYKDIGWVNRAPYAANGGWGGAISSNADPEKQKILIDFFLWAGGQEQSSQRVIPEATLPVLEINGQDPWRKSHLEVEKWEAQGYGAELSKQYVTTVLRNTQSKNVVVEIRIPNSGEIMSVLDNLQHDYLYRAVVEGSIPAAEREAERLRTAAEVTRRWKQIIDAYDARGDTPMPMLEIYQRLRGFRFPNEQKNQIIMLRPIGLGMFGIVSILCLVCAVWVARHQNDPVVKASQPTFLYIILFGTFVLGSSIITLSIDDSIADQQACSDSCMITVWFSSIGFNIIFVSLSTKMWRLSKVFERSRNFDRTRVSISEVIIPFVVSVSVQVVLLTIWTITGSIEWKRKTIGMTGSGDINSFGGCVYEGIPTKAISAILAFISFLSLVVANIQAIRNREIQSEFNEAQYIGMIMASMSQAFLIGIPVLLLTRQHPLARYTANVLLHFVVCMAVLSLIFFPKFKLTSRRQSETEQAIRRFVTARHSFSKTTSSVVGVNNPDTGNRRADRPTQHIPEAMKSSTSQNETPTGQCEDVNGASASTRNNALTPSVSFKENTEFREHIR